MRVSQEELRFNFQGAKFDLQSEGDRKLLAWVFNQFLYGEVTGIQCGHWLYRAPTLNAATFLAKQAGEELAHVRKILRILSLLGEKPGDAHWAIRFLATGMMGGSWGEHVALEMALGEGLVLGVFYAMADTIPDSAIQKMIQQAAVEEERHVEFGERETEAWLHSHPYSRKLILGMGLIQIWVLQKLKKFVIRTIAKSVATSHPVMSQMELFYDHSIRCFELRVERLGISDVPLKGMGKWEKLSLVCMIPFRLIQERFRSKTPLLTKSYLNDPVLESESKMIQVLSPGHE
jgi:hypothetical protein